MTTITFTGAVAAMREAGCRMDEAESYDDMARELGWDAIERGENPEQFVSECEIEAAEIAHMEWILQTEAEYEADRYETFC